MPSSAARFTGLLGGPVPGGVCGHARDVQPSGGVFEEHQAVETGAQGGVDVEEIDRDDGVGLAGQELPPGGTAPAGCWVDAGGVQYLPHGGGADAVAEPG
jgi:hypothetical protein